MNFNIELYEQVFNIDDEIRLNKKEEKYLKDLEEELEECIEEYGLNQDYHIKNIFHDTLLDDEQDNLINYLNLNPDEEIKEEIDKKLEDENFKKINNSEDDKEFFKDYLTDNTLNDLYFSWRGYVKKNEGTKEVFNKIGIFFFL